MPERTMNNAKDDDLELGDLKGLDDQDALEHLDNREAIRRIDDDPVCARWWARLPDFIKPDRIAPHGVSFGPQFTGQPTHRFRTLHFVGTKDLERTRQSRQFAAPGGLNQVQQPRLAGRTRVSG